MNSMLTTNSWSQCKHSLKRNRQDECQYVHDEVLYISSRLHVNIAFIGLTLKQFIILNLKSLSFPFFFRFHGVNIAQVYMVGSSTYIWEHYLLQLRWHAYCQNTLISPRETYIILASINAVHIRPISLLGQVLGKECRPYSGSKNMCMCKIVYSMICKAGNLIMNNGWRAAGEAPLIHEKVGMLSILL